MLSRVNRKCFCRIIPKSIAPLLLQPTLLPNNRTISPAAQGESAFSESFGRGWPRKSASKIQSIRAQPK